MTMPQKNLTLDNNYWWKQYRLGQYRAEKKVSKETLIRGSLKATCKEFLRHWTMAGVSHIAEPERGITERIFWIAIFIMTVTTLGFCISYIWSALSIPLIVSMDTTTYSIANIDFPAVALCNVNRISKKAVKKAANEQYDKYKNDSNFLKIYKNKELFERNMVFLGRFINFEYSEDVVTHNKYQFFNSLLETHELVEIMKNLSPRCSEQLMVCTWRNEEYPCEELFETRRTAFGHCCVFNYILDHTDGINRPTHTKKEIKRQIWSGRLNGLTVVLDPQVDDYVYPLRHMYGFDVLIFNGKHFPDMSGGRITHRFVEANTVSLLELTSRKQVATAEVRKYSPSTRNCLFHDEKPEEYGGMYSMANCISRCRLATVQALCKCTPFFLPISLTDGPVCSIGDLWCLSKHHDKLLYLYPHSADYTDGLEKEMRDSLFCPQCLPDCEHTEHVTTSYKIPVAGIRSTRNKIFRMNLFKGVNATDKSVLSVYQPTPDGTLDRLDVVLYWFELLSNFGGFAGLLLGMCATSAFELFYYFIIYFFNTLRRQPY